MHLVNEELEQSAEFKLQEDFYALTYLAYMKSNSQKYDISRKRQSRFFYSCLWVFML